MTSPDSVTVDLEPTLVLTSECLALIRALNGVRVPLGNNQRKADAKRDLIYLADTLDRASAEARAQYHAVNGKADLLEKR